MSEDLHILLIKDNSGYEALLLLLVIVVPSRTCHESAFDEKLTKERKREVSDLLPDGTSNDLFCMSYVTGKDGGVCSDDSGSAAVRFFANSTGWGYYMQLGVLVGGPMSDRCSGEGDEDKGEERLPPNLFVRLDHPEVGAFVRNIAGLEKKDEEDKGTTSASTSSISAATDTTTSPSTENTSASSSSTTTTTTMTSTTTTTTEATTRPATPSSTQLSSSSSATSPPTSEISAVTKPSKIEEDSSPPPPFIDPNRSVLSASGGSPSTTDEESVSNFLPPEQVQELLAGLVHAAVEDGDLASLRQLVEKGGADVNAVANASLGWTPLHAACLYNRSEVVSYLVELRETDVNAADAYGYRPIHYCARFGLTVATDELIGVGADLNIRDK